MWFVHLQEFFKPVSILSRCPRSMQKSWEKSCKQMYAVPIEMGRWSGLLLRLIHTTRTHTHKHKSTLHAQTPSPSNGGKKSHRKWFIIFIITTQMCRFSFSKPTEIDRTICACCILDVCDCVLVIRPFDNRVQKHACFWRKFLQYDTWTLRQKSEHEKKECVMHRKKRERGRGREREILLKKKTDANILNHWIWADIHINTVNYTSTHTLIKQNSRKMFEQEEKNRNHIQEL